MNTVLNFIRPGDPQHSYNYQLLGAEVLLLKPYQGLPEGTTLTIIDLDLRPGVWMTTAKVQGNSYRLPSDILRPVIIPPKPILTS